MMSKLFIVESPAKAKTILKYLEGEYKVVASIGHVRDLPKSNKKAIDIPAGFVPHYEISKGKEKIVSEIKSLAKKSDEILLATDPDREGEAIAWHIAEIIGNDFGKLKVQSEKPARLALQVKAGGLKVGNAKIKRITYHEITKEAIEEALEHPREIDQNLRRAQEARRVLDRLVGYDLSGLIWKKVRYGLSAGRVQSPALRIVMEREREIRVFKSHPFWIISADVSKNNYGGNYGGVASVVTVVCEKEPIHKKEVDRIVSVAEKGNWFVKDVKETEVKKTPRPPFITSTLQQTASSRLGFAPSRTMGIAQKLYEAGYITYMRTDSTNLAGNAIAQIAQVVESKFGKEFLQVRKFTTKSKNAQEAHEAIRPTHFNTESAGATDEQKKLYQLIWRRAVSSQMKDAQTLRTKISTNIRSSASNSFGVPDFSITGSRITFPGWLLGDPASRGVRSDVITSQDLARDFQSGANENLDKMYSSRREDVELPKVHQGETLILKKINTEEKQTEPLPRYSEAGLIKELEKRGIGRPSTYASIIKTLEDREYVNKINKALVPTDTGDVVSSFLENNFATYISDDFTADMEDKLDDIAEGKKEYVKTLKDFYVPFEKDVKSKEKLEKVTNLDQAPQDIKCPKCGTEMIIKLSRGGKFYSCSKYPDCDGALTLDGTELKGPEETGEMCPECNGGKLVIKERRDGTGTFISCSRYPKCKFVKKDEAEEAKKKTGVMCPLCKKGDISERRGRFGIFYSCSNYPDCKFAIKAKPTGNTCKECGSLMMLGTKTIPERCSKKDCPNFRPDKLNKKV
ncbi:MAG: type I DNA topoisomerase [Candidatus Zambryskibacteria bacterium]|nr:type I DNA topoisomerase [Candidatus Zambryskibacteria bacterium]